MRRLLRRTRPKLTTQGFRAQLILTDRLIDPRHRAGPDPGPDPPQAFEDAFVAEYGIPLERAVEAVAALEADALDRKQIVAIRGRDELQRVLAAKTGVRAEALGRFLHMITLPARDKWDQPKPKGFSARDWYPWRYRRRLSVVSRPVIQVDADNVIYALEAYLTMG